MAIMTNKQLVEQCKKMAGADGTVEKRSNNITYYKDRFGYVFGAQGETYTRELAKKWGAEKRAGKNANYFEIQCAHWFGRKVVDCSGMIVEAFRAYDSKFGDKTANYFYNRFTTKHGSISSLPETAGAIVWKSGHIGVYIGGGKVIEARGYAHGVVVSALSTQRWKGWGLLKEVEYVEETEIKSADKCVFTRLLKLTSPMQRGEDVKALQTLLNDKGYSPGKIDGIYGSKTRNAVKSFQRRANLTVDGIAGKKTTTALGGVWQG